MKLKPIRILCLGFCLVPPAFILSCGQIADLVQTKEEKIPILPNIAYVSKFDERGPGDIFVRTSEGAHINLTNTPGKNEITPSWSPDGAGIFYTFDPFVGSTDWDRGVFLVKLENRETTIFAEELVVQDASLSPDGKRIAFVSTFYETGIHVMNIDGSDRRIIVSGSNSVPFAPRWSPDGTKIAFYRNTDILTVNVDGTELTNLTQIAVDSDSHTISRGISDSFPSWSPDGSQIIFRTNDGRNAVNRTGIAIMNADGTGRKIIFDAIPVQAPSFSPDGEWIMFLSTHRTHEDYANIFVMRPDGSEVFNISKENISRHSSPVWSPVLK